MKNLMVKKAVSALVFALFLCNCKCTNEIVQ